MVPIAKAALVTLLLGCGTAGTFALANGGFGIGTASENSNEQNSDVPPASPEVANAAGGNADEVIPGPGAGTVESQAQVNQEGSPDPNVRDADTSEGRTATEETVNQPQDQGDTPPSVGAGDGLQETQSLSGTPGVEGASGPSDPRNPSTNEKVSLSNEHQGAEITTDESRGNTAVQQPADAGQEVTVRGQSQGQTQESARQTSMEGPKVVNTESSSSLQDKESAPPEQSSQVTGKEDGSNGNPQPALNTVSEPETKTDQTVTSSSEQEGGGEHTDTLDSGSSSDPQKK